jgi:hypothetical protein
MWKWSLRSKYTGVENGKKALKKIKFKQIKVKLKIPLNVTNASFMLIMK